MTPQPPQAELLPVPGTNNIQDIQDHGTKQHAVQHDFTKHLAHTAQRNIHIVRRPLFEHHIVQHVDEHHPVEHHISKHIFFKHVIITHAIFKHFVIEHLVIKNLISEHLISEHLISEQLIFKQLIVKQLIVKQLIVKQLIVKQLIVKQLIVKPLVVYIHVRKFYKCYPVKHLIIDFIVIAHFIVKQHITKLHNVYGYVQRFYENYIVKCIEQFTGVVGVYDHPQDGNKYAFTPLYAGVQSGFVAQFLFGPSGLVIGRPYRLKFYYGLGILTQTGSYGNCKLTLTMPGTYSVGNTIIVGNTPAGQYQLSDQIYTPNQAYNANPIIQVTISCADTANPADADFLLDNFSLTDSTQCP
ncbi:hypothetical protein GCG54_00012935 [Colletotrichum gloeosporioides]|uniref:Uncharacterized protein n=1 Tax=Colletotrichum gloeosporioides TaxID=474922 RepID=A0A8H4CTF4_COLGL|nr:uncharacterized protein GCG54_00012935 [Colletotrichum gloeosporioides]KAF3809647.1 hypothetical protein GCG54_00012935 [Colletotrichum gloeosporioides]